MPNHPWLEALRADLHRQGLPADYIDRFVQELDDHIEDLILEQEANMHTEVRETKADLAEVVEGRLGSREELSHRAVSEYRRESFTSLHPVLMFLIAPIPAVILCWALFFPLACLAPEGLGFVMGYGLGLIHEPVTNWPPAFTWTVRHLHGLSAFIPPALVILLWCRLFRRSGRARRWGMASCLLIAMTAGIYFTRLEPPTVDTKGKLTVGFCLTSSPTWQQLLQFFFPLVLGSYLVIRASRASKAWSPHPGQ
jgi:hypothetical protein